jgi:hypothetical protein
VAAGAVTDVALERDRALHRLQVLAAEIRVHEQAMRRSIGSRRRPADERLYRRLRQVNGATHDGEKEVVPLMGYPHELLPYG